MPVALAGDIANRPFFFEIDEKGELTVDYHYYLGQIQHSDDCFYTIKDYQTPNMLDFEAAVYAEQIENAIDKMIATLDI